MKECIRCGAPLEEGDQFCKKCGAITDIAQEKNDTVFNKTTNDDFNDFGKSVVEQPIQTPKEENNIEEKINENTVKDKQNNSKNNKIFIVIIGMLVVVLIGIAIFAAMTVMKEKEDDDEPKSKASKNTTSEEKENSTKNELEENDDEEDEEDDEEEKDNTVSKPKSNNEKIEFAGYELVLPEDLENVEYATLKQNGQEVLALEDSELGWSATISEIDDINFEQFKENIDDLETIFASAGITVDNVYYDTYGEIEVISLENIADDEDSEKMLIALAKTPDGKLFEIDIYSDYIYEYMTLTDIEEMLDSSKYTGKTSSSQSEKNNNFDDLEEDLKVKTIDLKKVQEKLNN